MDIIREKSNTNIKTIFFYISWLALGCFTISLVLKKNNFLQHAYTLEAQVVENPSNPLFKFNFKGHTLFHKSNVTTTPPSYHLGQKVKIYYHPNIYPNVVEKDWISTWILEIVIGLLTLVGFPILFWSFKNPNLKIKSSNELTGFLLKKNIDQANYPTHQLRSFPGFELKMSCGVEILGPNEFDLIWSIKNIDIAGSGYCILSKDQQFVQCYKYKDKYQFQHGYTEADDLSEAKGELDLNLASEVFINFAKGKQPLRLPVFSSINKIYV